MPFHNDDEIKDEDEMDDEEATLADDLLDEVGVDEEDPVDEDIEGFGHITEDVAEEKEEEDEDKVEEDAALEDDAEDVDFDTFDDVDEM